MADDGLVDTAVKNALVTVPARFTAGAQSYATHHRVRPRRGDLRSGRGLLQRPMPRRGLHGHPVRRRIFPAAPVDPDATKCPDLAK